MTRILVIDGNEEATRKRHVAVGGTSSGEGYAATLKRLNSGIETDIVRPADGDPKLPDGVALKDYQGSILLPGIKINTGRWDFRPIKHLRLVQFDGRSWQPIGDVLETAFSRSQN